MKQRPYTKDNITEYFRDKMAFEAEQLGYFVVLKNKWYTPAEFRGDNRIVGETKDVSLKDPVNGIERMRTRLDELERKLAAFSQKVAVFYRDKKGKR